MCLPEGFNLRRASTTDLETLVEHRRAMFEDMGYSDVVALTSMATKFGHWLLKHINAGDYHAGVRAGDKGSHYRRLGPEPGTRLEMIPREPRLAGTR